jgi:hypothetical protein
MGYSEEEEETKSKAHTDEKFFRLTKKTMLLTPGFYAILGGNCVNRVGFFYRTTIANLSRSPANTTLWYD